MNYSAINIQGNVISGEILEKLSQASEEVSHQTPGSFGFEKKSELRDHIGTAWAECRVHWEIYKRKLDRLEDDDPGTSVTRKFWMELFLYELGYDLAFSQAEEVAGKLYPISHRSVNLDRFPVLIMGYHDRLDSKPDRKRLRMSPHALLQEYLNYTEHLYGLVTNGRQLRLLRDTNRLARLAYLEFDVERIMEEELYHEFALLFRLLHRSRMPQKHTEGENSIMEEYHQDSLDSGARIRDKLRMAVKDSMVLLGKGMLEHHQNEVLRSSVADGSVKPANFYKLLLRTMYRIIFLATIEERNLVFRKIDPKDPGYERTRKLRKIYEENYSIQGLRKLAIAPIYIDPRKDNLWQSLLTTFRFFEPGSRGEVLGLAPLGGDLFGADSLKIDDTDFYDLHVANDYFLEIFRKLTMIRDERNTLARVNYRDLDVEELGSVYEALLELHPYFDTEGGRVLFGFTEGSERKLTGSYYTRHDLVAQLIKSALIPVIEDKLKEAGWDRMHVRGDAGKAEQALLGIRVCDPAAGSGHFLLAAARILGFELAMIRSGEENPGEEWVHASERDVIRHCIYGVDKNPDAVELCKLGLWLVGHNSGKPLTFLDHKIKCGDSLVGVNRLERLREGIPEGAFKTVTDSDSAMAGAIKKANRDFMKTRQYGLFTQSLDLMRHGHEFAEEYEAMSALQEDSQQDYEQKRNVYRKISKNPRWQKDRTACNLYTWAFFQPYTEGSSIQDYVTSELWMQFLQSHGSVHAKLEGLANARALENRFFHWELEFPDVFKKGGFDVVLGNPPWERIKLQEKEFFAARDTEIANAPNKAARTRLIKTLKERNPNLYSEFQEALHIAESASKFIRESDTFPLAGRGDVNTYSVFSELATKLANENGRSGILVPTGIATDDTNKFFFANLVESNRLVSLFDFENKKALFPGVHRSYKFCLLTVSGGMLSGDHEARFAFFLHDILDLQDDMRVFSLSKEDFLNINPNTKTCPVFRTKIDAELTKKIYRRVPVLINEDKGWNPWGISFLRMFDMSNDSHLFRTAQEMRGMGFEKKGNQFYLQNNCWLRLYEGRNCWIYDNRLATYSTVSEDYVQTHDKNPDFIIETKYYVNKDEVSDKLSNKPCKKWFFGIRRVTNNTNERMVVGSFVPYSGVTYGLYLFFSPNNIDDFLFLCCLSNSIPFDFVARNSTSQPSLTYSVLYQLPVFHHKTDIRSIELFIISRCIELSYTSWDMKGLVDEIWDFGDEKINKCIIDQYEENVEETGGCVWNPPRWRDSYQDIEWERDKGCPLPPFKWDEDRRAKLKAELDAWYALLYGLERDELRYILDPQDVYGDSFPGETFRVLKEKEIRKYGEYRTRRLVLEAYDRLRPDFDMEGHLKKLEAVMEEYRNMPSVKKEEEKPQKVKPKTSTKSKKRETAPNQPDLFTVTTPLFAQAQESEAAEPEKEYGGVVQVGSKVNVWSEEARRGFKFHIVKNQDKHSPGEYQQIRADSNFGRFLMGKKVGDVVKIGGVEYGVKTIF